jgi:hypothetical protein
MVYLQAYDKYVPIFFCLMTSKCEDSYIHAIQACISAANWDLTASTYCSDFEKGLINALKMQFNNNPDAKV